MAWNEAVVTNLGLALLAESVTRGNIVIKRAAGGESCSAPVSMMAQSKIPEPVHQLRIAKLERNGNVITVNVRIQNTGLEQPYTLKQIGLFAGLEADEDEVLFALIQDENGEKIPSQTDNPEFLVEFDFVISVSNSERISAHVTPATFATVDDVNEVMEAERRHSADTVMHITAAERQSWNSKADKIVLGEAEFSPSKGTVTVTNTAVQKAVTPAAPTSGQVAVYDGTAGQMKSSGYTIAANVPSGAKFTDTDTKVTQTVTTANAAYPLLLAPNGQTATTTTTSFFDSGVTLNPSNNTIAANISGNAATATTATAAAKLSTDAGSATQPVYFSGGVPVKTTHTLEKSVPANAVFTDTNTAKASATATVGSASKWSAGTLPTLGNAIAADDITAWSAGSLPTLGTAIPADDITAWSAGTLPTLGNAIAADDITAWSAGTAATAAVSKGVLTITNGTAPTLTYTARSIPNVTAVGTLPSLTYAAKSIPNVTGVGTLPSLSYTARSIPNVTAVGTLPSLTVTNTTVVTGVST